MARKRKKENLGLPTRWRFTRNAYYYQVPVGMKHLWDSKVTFKLGATLPEAYRVWADRIQPSEKAKTVTDLLERYSLEVLPTKSKATQHGDKRCIKSILEVFGAMQLHEVKPTHIYQYVDKRRKKVVDEKGQRRGGLTQARHEISLLSKAYSQAVKWGYIDNHPFKNEIRLDRAPSRTRYVTDEEIIEVLSLKSTRDKGSIKAIQAYIRIKLLTGMARGDLLRLTLPQLKDDGIYIQRNKTKNSTGKQTVYEWSDELKLAIDEAKKARPTQITAYLFCTRRGQPYINEETEMAAGWDSMWQRFMGRVITETKVSGRFTEHDLRAKCASDAATLEHARALLSHADSRITDKIYRRKPERVKPLR